MTAYEKAKAHYKDDAQKWALDHLDNDGDWDILPDDAYLEGMVDLANLLPDYVKNMLNRLFKECEHGDEEHRQWLQNKFNDFLKREIVKDDE